jgi:hypothetical protein
MMKADYFVAIFPSTLFRGSLRGPRVRRLQHWVHGLQRGLCVLLLYIVTYYYCLVGAGFLVTKSLVTPFSLHSLLYHSEYS